MIEYGDSPSAQWLGTLVAVSMSSEGTDIGLSELMPSAVILSRTASPRPVTQIRSDFSTVSYAAKDNSYNV